MRGRRMEGWERLSCFVPVWSKFGKVKAAALKCCDGRERGGLPTADTFW